MIKSPKGNSNPRLFSDPRFKMAMIYQPFMCYWYRKVMFMEYLVPTTL